MNNKKLIKAVKNLLKAIDDNQWSLWENSLEYKPECILLDEGEYELDCDENDKWIMKNKTGIYKELQAVKNLINNEGSK